MKILRVLLIAILVSLFCYPAYSQESLVLYDNFRGKNIDPNKWQPKGVAENEILEIKRFIKGNRLHLMERSYGGTEDNFGRIATGNRLAFQNPNVTAIKAKLKVKHFELVGCPSNPEPGLIRAGRLSGFFFNTVGVESTDNGAIDDVLASIEIFRHSNSLDPDDMLRIRGYVFWCSDEGCYSGEWLGIVDLGPIMVGQFTKLQLQWDPDNDQFIFQRDNGHKRIVTYNVPDDFPPNISQKRIGISAFVPNCTEEPRTVGYAEVEIKNVFVNESVLE